MEIGCICFSCLQDDADKLKKKNYYFFKDPSGKFGSSTHKWNQMVNEQGVYGKSM